MKAITKIISQGQLDKASHALILLHGRGGTAEDILSIANQICDKSFYVVAPQAINNIWYPQSFMADEKMNEPYLSNSIEAISELIDQIAKTISKSKIFIAGFSQGACLSLEFSSRNAVKYGGIMAFTGGLIGNTINVSKYQGRFENTKIFISNGDDDPYIPLERSKESKKVMEDLGANVSFKIYPGRPHIITKDELIFVRENIIKTEEKID